MKLMFLFIGLGNPPHFAFGKSKKNLVLPIGTEVKEIIVLYVVYIVNVPSSDDKIEILACCLIFLADIPINDCTCHWQK